MSLQQRNEASINFVACQLRQPVVSQQQDSIWGMWVGLQGEDNALLVATIQHHVFDSLLQWSWTTSSPPDTAIIWNRSFGSDLWKSYFSMLPPPPAYNNTMPGTTLLPGDVILAINGFPISAFGGSMVSVTNYLRQCPHLFVVAARSSTPAIQALQNAVTKSQSVEHVKSILQQISLLASGYAPQQPTHIQQPTPLFAGWQAHIPPHPPTYSHHQQQPQRPVMSRVVTPMKLAQTGGIPWAYQSPNHPSMVPVTPESATQKPPAKRAQKAGCTKLKANTTLAWPTTRWRNPMFRNTDGENKTSSSIAVVGIPYDDNGEDFDPEDGTRSKKYLVRINSSNFSEWLRLRKQTWRSKWNVEVSVSTTKAANIVRSLSVSSSMPTCFTNAMFHERNNYGSEDGTARIGKRCPIPYTDNNTFDPYEGSRSSKFLPPVNSSNWSSWLQSRKQKWRSNWKVYKVESEECNFASNLSQCERQECTVRYDFWAERYPSFDGWLAASAAKWKNTYSWNSRKRKRIQLEWEEVVQFPSSHDPKIANAELVKWLRVRKNQWRISRRKRQRRLEEAALESSATNHQTNASIPAGVARMEPSSPERQSALVHVSGDFMHIDALLEEEERKKKLRKEREPVDISFLFLPSSGCPDDVVAHCLRYLDHAEHGKLLCINSKFATGLKSRSHTWQQLCPSHWCLPRRMRKPWHELYLSKLRMEARSSRKQWDDLVSKISEVLLKGDQLKVVVKLIEKAEKKFNFTVDFVSGVVCERNSILNLAVIHQRHKVVHWLVEQKKADLETSDRGHFTPLINAAWAGNKKLVRFLLSHGANRAKVGRGHYTEALAHSDFEGLTAEGWARRKDFGDIAELIRVGL